MVEKVRRISNPLTIIAIFAALAEINATISIGLVDKELQEIFLWFVILFPTLLVILFFITLIFFTEVIYAPSDYKDDSGFHKSLFGDFKEPDSEINVDTDIIKKTLNELGIKPESKEDLNINVSDNVNYLFGIRYTIEKEIRRIASKNLDINKPHPVIRLIEQLVDNGIITRQEYKAIRNIYSITSPAIHGDEKQITLSEIEFVKHISPGMIQRLKRIE